MPAAAVVVNPLRLPRPDALRAAAGAALAAAGFGPPLWLETAAADQGAGAARAALDAGARLVLACGGDGTITACAGVLAGSGVPLAVLPSGTGNLLARNLGLPRRLQPALAVALSGRDRRLDVGIVNGRPFLVMAGVGFDARALAASAPVRRLGWAAYYLGAARHLLDAPMRLTVQAGQAAPVRCRATACVVGNVGVLPGGLRLLPQARPDDGVLDLALLTARGPWSWTAVAGQLVLRRPAGPVAWLAGRRLRISLDTPAPWQRDGEYMGRTGQLDAGLLPGPLLLRVPDPGPGRPAAGSGPPSAGPAGKM